MPFIRKKKAKQTESISEEERSKKLLEIQDFMVQKEKENDILLKQAETKHLIFVGKSRNGKSTAQETMKSPFSFVEMGSFYAGTSEAKINHFTVEVEGEEQSQNFNISVIDTPGLFEVRDVGTSRDNDELEAVVLKCMNAEITKIHAIFFVIAYGSSGINPQDIEALERFINLFNGAQKNVHLLVTRCEGLSPVQKQDVKDELVNFPGFKDLIKLISKDIYFLGAVEQAEMDNCFVDAFKSKLTNVISMRDELFDGIFQMNEPFDLNALQISDSVRTKARDLYKTLKTSNENRDAVSNLAMFKNSVKQLKSWANFLPLGERKEMRELCGSLEQFIDAVEYLELLKQEASRATTAELKEAIKEKVKDFEPKVIHLNESRKAEAENLVKQFSSE